MLSRKLMTTLSLLCALTLCALAAQNASAAEANNTTAVKCVKEGGNKDFADEHCDEKVTAGLGNFGHVAIPLNETTEVSLTNEKTAEKTTKSTPATMKGTLGGVQLHIECATVHGKGTFKNEEPSSKVHTGNGTGSTEMSGCTVLKPANCLLSKLSFSVAGVPVEGLGSEKNTMGGELKPVSGGTFVSFKLEGEKCALKTFTIEVKGTVIATGTPNPKEKSTGATARYEPGNEMEKLTIGEKTAEFSLTTTVRAVAKGGELIPLSGTTTT